MGATLSSPYGTTLLGQKKLIIGSGGDLNVDGPGVATRQAEIQAESGAYWVADLNSKLGTTLNGRRLTGGERQMLHDGDVIGIAGQVNFIFHRDGIEQISQSSGKVTGPLPVQEEVTPRSIDGPSFLPWQVIPPQPGRRAAQAPGTDPLAELRLEVSLSEIQTEPGSPVEIKVLIENLSPDTENYSLKVEGLDPRWYRIPIPTTGNLNSITGSRALSTKRELSIFVNPPRSVKTAAGVYAFLIKAIAHSSNVAATKPATLTVLPFTGFDMTLDPPIAATRRAAAYQLVLVNQSNLPTGLSVQAKDAQGELLFKAFGNNNQVHLEAGERAEFTLHSAPRHRPVFGSPRTHCFAVTARPLLGPGSDTRSVNGQLIYRPLIPLWAILGALLGLLIAAAGGGFLFYQGQQAAEMAATATAGQWPNSLKANNTAAAQETATQIAIPTVTARAALRDEQLQGQATLTAWQIAAAKTATASAPMLAVSATANAQQTAEAKQGQDYATAVAQSVEATTLANQQAGHVYSPIPPLAPVQQPPLAPAPPPIQIIRGSPVQSAPPAAPTSTAVPAPTPVKAIPTPTSIGVVAPVSGAATAPTIRQPVPTRDASGLPLTPPPRHTPSPPR